MSLFADTIYDALCRNRNNPIQPVKSGKLLKYDTREERLTSESALIHRFVLPHTTAVANIILLTQDTNAIEEIALVIQERNEIVKLRKPMLKLVYGAVAIMTLSDAMCCYRDQPIVVPSYAKSHIEVRLENAACAELILEVTANIHECIFKPDKYPLYQCRTQDEINAMFVRKLNDLTSMINSGKFVESELIQTVNKHLVPNTQDKCINVVQYFDAQGPNYYLCVEYLRSILANREDFYYIIRDPWHYCVGFYLYMDNGNNVFDYLHSIQIRFGAYWPTFNITQNELLKFGSVAFLSLVKEFRHKTSEHNSSKPWLVKDIYDILGNVKELPDYNKINDIEVKLSYYKGVPPENQAIHIQPIRLNMRLSQCHGLVLRYCN